MEHFEIENLTKFLFYLPPGEILQPRGRKTETAAKDCGTRGKGGLEVLYHYPKFTWEFRRRIFPQRREFFIIVSASIRCAEKKFDILKPRRCCCGFYGGGRRRRFFPSFSCASQRGQRRTPLRFCLEKSQGEVLLIFIDKALCVTEIETLTKCKELYLTVAAKER